jgi:hypothetical protein
MDKNRSKTTIQHSNYWLDSKVWDDDDVLADDTREANSISRLFRLASIRRGIGNFVQIMTSKNIPVEFSSGRDSYTDGKSVVISADENPSKFDSMVGLALHEASHIMLTDFEFIQQWKNLHDVLSAGYYPNNFNGSGAYVGSELFDRLFPAPLAAVVKIDVNRRDLIEGYRTTLPDHVLAERMTWMVKVAKMLRDIKDLMNILEDRRIDKFVYSTAAGYRPYYDAMYNKYFFTEEIGKNLKYNPEWREPTVENYLNHILFAFHPDSDPTALAGLDVLLKMVDLPNIDRVGHVPADEKKVPLWKSASTLSFENTPVLWQEACNLYAYILKFAIFNAQRTEQPKLDMFDTQQASDALDNLPNLDGMPTSPADMQPTEVQTGRGGKAGTFNGKKADKEVQTAKDVMDGNLKKKKISASDAEAVKSIEQASADIVDIQGEGVPFGKCIVTRKITEAMLGQEWFIFGRRDGYGGRSNAMIEEAIAHGKRMGAILLQRLQVRNDPLVTKQTRLMNGGIDRRLLSQLGMDIESVFHKNRVDQHRPAMLHLTLDASGSMSGQKWAKVVTVAVALAHVGAKMRNVDTVISLRGGNDIPMVSVLYDSRKDQLSSFMKFIRHVGPAGSTPEGLCFKATMDLILENNKTHDVYFINFSDGEPSFSYRKTGLMGKTGKSDNYWDANFSYHGDLASSHTRKQIQNLREHGVKVLSYFISEGNLNYRTSSVDCFHKMYGEDASFVNVNNATEVVRTLNKLLLARGA